MINSQVEYVKMVIVLLDGVKDFEEAKVSVVESGLLKVWVGMCEQGFDLGAGKSGNGYRNNSSNSNYIYNNYNNNRMQLSSSDNNK